MDESQETQNPALEQARAEAKDIITNEKNPRYEAYHRGDKSVSAHIEGLYAKAVSGGDGKVEIGTDGLDTFDFIQSKKEGTQSPLGDMSEVWAPADYQRKQAMAVEVGREMFGGRSKALGRLGEIAGVPHVINLFAQAGSDPELKGALHIIAERLNR